MKKIIFYSALLILLNTFVKGQGLIMNYNVSPGQTANNIQGAGLSITNAQGFTGPNSSATFSNNNVAGFSIDSGVVWSTGNLQQMNNPSSYYNSTDLGFAGDQDINTIHAPQLSYDAQYLTFDFMAASDSVEFTFSYSSEDYNNAVNSLLIDAFAIIINGPGYVNKNIAVIPGTNVPLSTNAVNNGTANGPSNGPCNNCQYYIDNDGTGNIDLSPDGFITPITLKFEVMPCTLYSVKIVLADLDNGFSDSQLYFKHNSFKTFGIYSASQLGNPILSGDSINICSGGIITATLPLSPNYIWSTGDTTQSLIITQPGTYQYYTIFNSCFAYGEFSVYEDDTIQPPVISQQNNLLVSVISGNIIAYQWYLEGNLIPGATQPNYQFPTNGCYTLHISSASGCEALSNIVCISNTGIESRGENILNIFPNPVTGISTVVSPFKKGSVTTILLFDQQGKLLHTVVIADEGNLNLSKNSLAPGLYFIEIKNSLSKEIYKSKIVIL